MSTRQIWKYVIKTNKLIHKVPANGKVLHVDEQFGEICVWIEVDPDEIKEERHFEVYGTGHLIKYDIGTDRNYLGSVKLENGALIFHIYEYLGV